MSYGDTYQLQEYTLADRASTDERASFITKTYLHLLGAVIAFVILEAILLNLPITQQVESITLQTEDQLTHYINQPCIACGDCVKACPIQLLPNEISKFCEYGLFDAAEKNDLFYCIECGVCAYVCPASRPMVQLMRFGKQQILDSRE